MKCDKKVIRRWFTGLVLVAVCSAVGQAAPPSDLDKANAAVKAVAAEKAAAEKALAEKVAAEKAAAEKAAAAKTAADKATAEKAAAEKALAEKVAAEKAAAAALTAAKAAAEKAAVDARNAQGQALTAKAAAEKTRSQKVAAVAKAAAAEKAATDKAVAAKAAAGKATAEKAAADKALVDKTAGDQKAATALANANKVVATAKTATEKAAAEKTAAEKTVAEKTAAAKAATDAAVAEKDAAKKKVAEQVATKAAAEKTAAEKALAEKVAAVPKAAAALTAAQKVQASSKAVADKAAAEKTAATKLVADKTVVVKKTTADLAAADKAAAAAKTAAQKPNAEKVAADKVVAEKDVAWKAAIAKSAATLANTRGGLTPLAANAWDYAKARHLLVRSGFGATPDEVAKLHALGLHAAVDFVVDFDKQPTVNIAFSGLPPDRPDPLEGKYSTEVRTRINAARTNRENAQLARLRLWWLERLVESPRPLQEKLTLFWHGHFATQYNTVRNSYAFYLQNQLFRDNAAGNFGALLYGIAHDPVMIRYLNNNDNYKGHPNENLAREIMELFAMGLDQGYTEEDIREAARALTGYNFDNYTAQFRYVDSQHDTENKTIFGKTGNWSGDDLVKLILEQPVTARFIGEKLFNFFAYQDPADQTVDRLASVLRANNYELAPLLKNLFLSEEFYSEQAMGTQIKSPVQLTVGMLRDFGVKGVSDYRPLDAAIQGAGQTLFQPPDVKGWRLGQAWIDANRVFLRYNSTASLLRSIARPDVRGVDVVAVLEGKDCKTSAEVVDHLLKTCFVKPLGEQKRKELVDFLGELPPQPEWANQRSQINGRLHALLVLMLSTPNYQMT
ncbi:MAG: DUF1800 domain-containing protein [Pirellulaceae bacterium]|nr:DUF1800 domain-containing protein [Pirellulaceae bacterium]HJN12412.1 DUF1800 domain-containing protein [Pirellulaceae bacterium]